MKSCSLPAELHFILLGLSTEEDSGILGVAVKCLEIQENAGDEGGYLVRY